MFPASCKAGGQALGTPDVCLTPAPPSPPVPTPYPNMAMLPQATPPTCARRVNVGNQPAITLATQIPMSSGDEAGVNGGVMSGMFKGPVAFKRGSVKVKIEGNAAAFLTSTTAHNGSNANMPAGAQVAPSQAKVIIMS
jgi:hypothetical protein